MWCGLITIFHVRWCPVQQCSTQVLSPPSRQPPPPCPTSWRDIQYKQIYSLPNYLVVIQCKRSQSVPNQLVVIKLKQIYSPCPAGSHLVHWRKLLFIKYEQHQLNQLVVKQSYSIPDLVVVIHNAVLEKNSMEKIVFRINAHQKSCVEQTVNFSCV